MRGRRVLVVGAGIAGATAAFWLAREGFEVTVVERASGRRSSGSPVDVRGPAAAVVTEMGLLPQLRRAATAATTVAFVDAAGRAFARLPIHVGGDAAVEIPRAALAAALVAAAGDDVEFRWGDTVTALADDGAGVDVSFQRGPPLRVDLVVGADGLHSRVRRLAFGPEEDVVGHLGLFVATVTLDGPVADEQTVLVHNAPGRSLSVHPSAGPAVGAFIFRGRADPALLRGRGRQEDLLTRTYEGDGWRAPDLLARALAAEDLYFDAVSRVRLPRWSTGRIVLVGDAASCVSLLGEGSSLAITGAATLARALGADPDLGSALRRYETVHRRRVAPRGRGALATGRALVPATRGGLLARNLALRCVSRRDATPWRHARVEE